MAIGEWENNVEMLELASLGIALSNGSEKTKDVADLIGVGNGEDGVADAIYRYAFWRPTSRSKTLHNSRDGLQPEIFVLHLEQLGI